MLSFKIEVFNKHVVVAHLFMANQWCNICELFAILMAAESIAICLSLWHDFTFGDSLINKVLGGLKFYFVWVKCYISHGAQKFKVADVSKDRLLVELSIDEFDAVLLKSLTQLAKLIVSIFLISDIISSVWKDNVIAFVLDLAIDMKQVNMLLISLL